MNNNARSIRIRVHLPMKPICLEYDQISKTFEYLNTAKKSQRRQFDMHVRRTFYTENASP